MEKYVRMLKLLAASAAQELNKPAERADVTTTASQHAVSDTLSRDIPGVCL